MKNKNNNTIVYKISDNLKEEIIEHYTPLFRDKKPPYSIFQADDGAGTVVTLYESGKLMFQGISADLDFQYWKEREKYLNERNISEEVKKEQDKKEKKKEELNDPRFKFVSTIGSDEVGTGDYFGPIIVTASYVSKDDIPFIAGLGVKDSKKITDKKIMEIAPKIMERIPYESYILSPTEYNTKKYKNLNGVKAMFHNKVLRTLRNKHYSYSYIVVDQFCSEKSYFWYLNFMDDKYIVKNITFTTKAESKCYSVAAASVISRYLFLEEMDKLSKKLGKEIPRGAGENVDIFVRNLLKEKPDIKLEDYVKLNFTNTEKIKGQNN